MTNLDETGAIAPDAIQPDAIRPDDKDWTWVLNQPCGECGFDPGLITVDDVPALVRASLPRWAAALARPEAAQRPDPQRWSVLEYGCHVRDVFTIFDERFELMLAQDTPQFANWDQDATAIAERYDQQDLVAVSEGLTQAGERIAGRISAIEPVQHERRGLRSNGSEFTVATLASYFWHDVHHHLHDVDA